MPVTKQTLWRALPPVTLAAPVMALASGPGGLWGGSVGGIAWLPAGEEWQSLTASLPISSVSALYYTEGLLLAGGTNGIARSTDGGKSWQAAATQEGVVTVMALAVSPEFTRDQTALVATLESGILRSDDGGRTWHSASFGLQSFEVTALSWEQGNVVLAATTEGLYRSTNAGRAWKIVRDSDGMVLVALARLPDGSVLAAQEEGELLRSQNGGLNWEPFMEPPADVQVTALWITPEGSILLGTAGHGLLRSGGAVEEWQEVLPGSVLSFTANSRILYAGTATSIFVSVDDGATWRELSQPPIHDLSQVLAIKNTLVLAGSCAGIVRLNDEGEWEISPNEDLPFTAFTVGPNGKLFASNTEELLLSHDAGRTWRKIVEGASGNLARITFRNEREGWAASADGRFLMRTVDGGESWSALPSPFGILPVAALQASPGMVLAITYDPRQYQVLIWRSLDNGENWIRGLEAQTMWPLVCTHDQPLLLTFGNLLLAQRGKDEWVQVPLGSEKDDVGAPRRIVGNERTLYMLTTDTLLRSDDQGQTWKRDDEGFESKKVLDIGIVDNALYALLTGGQVLVRAGKR